MTTEQLVPRRRARAIREGLNAAGGAAVVVLAVLERLGGRAFDGPLALDLAAVAVLGVLIAVRDRAPRVAVAAFLGVLVVQTAVLSEPQALRVEFVPVLLLAYTAGARLAGRALGLWVLAWVAVIEVAVLRFDSGVTTDLLFFPAVGIGAVVAGRATRRRAQLVADLERTTRQLEDRQEATARRAVAEERRRIAHELHDVVAHAISVMVVQAGGGRRVLATDAARARDAAAEIERTGREALLEMRRLLAVLREPDAPAEREPNPTLDGLPDLLERLAADGLRLHFESSGEPRPVSAGLGLGAYRVIEDAVGDVVRADPRAHCDVRVEWGAEALQLRVSDDRGDEEDEEPGLLGVRERVAVYGGTVSISCSSTGGRELVARFPLDPHVPIQITTGGAA